MNPIDNETKVTIEDLEDKMKEFWAAVNQYTLRQDMKIEDSGKLEFIHRCCLDITNQIKKSYDSIVTLKTLAYRDKRCLWICNSKSGKKSFYTSSILQVFSEGSEVGERYAKKIVASCIGAAIYLYNPVTDEIVDVTDKYKE